MFQVFKFQTISSHCRLDIERKNSQINIVQGKVWHVNKLDSMMEHLIRPVQSIPFHWLCLCLCSLYVKSRLQPTAVTTSYKSLQSNVFCSSTFHSSPLTLKQSQETHARPCVTHMRSASLPNAVTSANKQQVSARTSFLKKNCFHFSFSHAIASST